MPMFARVPSGPPSQKVVSLTLCEKFLVQTDRTTTYSYLSMELPEAETWGPHIESLYAQTVSKNRTANLTWKVACTWSNDGGNNFSTPVTDVTSDIITDVQTNHTAITTGFQGRLLRFVIGAKNGAGTSVESAIIWVYLVFTFKT